MIVGNGMVARGFCRFSDDESLVVFASGVANSKEMSEEPYSRERALLLDAINANQGKRLVYFSTCSIGDPELAGTKYVLHKKRIEQLIQGDVSDFIIFRLPQVVGRSANKNTLVNFLHDKMVRAESFSLWKNAARYIIDIDDVVAIATYIIRENTVKNKTINIVSRLYSIIEIVKTLEKITKLSARYSLENRGSSYHVDDLEIQEVKKKLNMQFDEHYLERVLKKYYR